MQISRIRLSVWKFVFIAPVPRTFSVSFHFGHDGIVQLGQAVCGSPHHLRIAPFDSPFGQYISYPQCPLPSFFTQRPFAPLLGHRFATRCRSGDTHGRCPASPLLWPRPTPRFAFAIARPPKFLTELSRRVVLLCPAAPARPKPIRALGVGFTASELLAARNSSNETLRRRFICIATHLFVRQDSRIRVAPLTACRPNHISVCL